MHAVSKQYDERETEEVQKLRWVADVREIRELRQEPVEWGEAPKSEQERGHSADNPKPEQLTLVEREDGVVPAQCLRCRPNTNEQHEHPDIRAAPRIAH